ncbi:MAG: ribonuclease R [Spirochaetes bacterium]|nr:ribonuclease R [Spirochaetota bacterium]
MVKKHLLIKHLDLSEKEYRSVERLVDEAVDRGLLMRARKKGTFRLTRDGEKMIARGTPAPARRSVRVPGGKDGERERKPFMPVPYNAKDDVAYIISKHQLPRFFSKKVEPELKGIPAEVPESAFAGREDIREWDVVTIDGEDAKDFDDAINVAKTDGGYTVGVHIADVGHFIPEGSALDREAAKRANSFYLIDTVIPMFPFAVSNGICSLNPNVPRLTMSVIMDLATDGTVRNYRFANTVIRSKARLTYNYAQDVIDGKAAGDDWLKKLLHDANELMAVLRAKRVSTGSIDFDFDERKIVLDERGEPVTIGPKKRLDTHRIVEELMLLANRVVAEYLSKHTESLYRVHGLPDEDKLANFERIAFNRGYKLTHDAKTNDIDFAPFMESIKGKPDEKLLLTLLLRSMKQAYYDTDNIGHYGLGFEFYTHFTSPIRRYSDLVVHRLLKKIMRGAKDIGAGAFQQLKAVAEHCSKQERIAVEAERDIAKIKGARFLKDKVGLEYDAIITGVTSFGVFVEISEYSVEGLVRFADLAQDSYTFNEDDHSLTGRGGNMYMLGDRVRIMVHRVNVERMFVDLIMLGKRK